VSEHNTQSPDSLGPYAVFVHDVYGDRPSGTANVLATCACTLGVLGFSMLVSVGFSGSILVLGLGIATSVLALILGAYGVNAAAGSNSFRAAAIVGMSSAAVAILGSTGLAVFAVWQTP
jgi:hypothetical protein